MNIAIDTFGNTPAAKYLARLLNELNNKNVLSAVGKRITATSRQVTELADAYEVNMISPKTLGNCLRLMREDIVIEPEIINCDRIISQLCSNVRIGFIKRLMFTAKLASKADSLMNRPNSLKTSFTENGIKEFWYFDKESDQNILAGIEVLDDNGGTNYIGPFFPPTDKYQKVNAQVLNERSEKRCARLNKHVG